MACRGCGSRWHILEAKVVISLMGCEFRLKSWAFTKRVGASHVAVGVKELIELPKSVIEDRFQLQATRCRLLRLPGRQPMV